MAETKPKTSLASATGSQRLPGKKAAPRALPSLEEITPARFARLNNLQRRALTLKLIEFLKSI